MFLSGADRDCKKGRDPDVEVKGGPAFSCIEGWVQARLVVITATFTYDAKSSATPTQRPAGESNPGDFCKHKFL